MPEPLIAAWSFGVLFACVLAAVCVDGARRLWRRWKAKRAAARVWGASA